MGLEKIEDIKRRNARVEKSIKINKPEALTNTNGNAGNNLIDSIRKRSISINSKESKSIENNNTHNFPKNSEEDIEKQSKQIEKIFDNLNERFINILSSNDPEDVQKNQLNDLLNDLNELDVDDGYKITLRNNIENQLAGISNKEKVIDEKIDLSEKTVLKKKRKIKPKKEKNALSGFGELNKFVFKDNDSIPEPEVNVSSNDVKSEKLEVKPEVLEDKDKKEFERLSNKFKSFLNKFSDDPNSLIRGLNVVKKDLEKLEKNLKIDILIDLISKKIITAEKKIEDENTQNSGEDGGVVDKNEETDNYEDDDFVANKIDLDDDEIIEKGFGRSNDYIESENPEVKILDQDEELRNDIVNSSVIEKPVVEPIKTLNAKKGGRPRNIDKMKIGFEEIMADSDEKKKEEALEYYVGLLGKRKKLTQDEKDFFEELTVLKNKLDQEREALKDNESLEEIITHREDNKTSFVNNEKKIDVDEEEKIREEILEGLESGNEGSKNDNDDNDLYSVGAVIGDYDSIDKKIKAKSKEYLREKDEFEDLEGTEGFDQLLEKNSKYKKTSEPGTVADTEAFYAEDEEEAPVKIESSQNKNLEQVSDEISKDGSSEETQSQNDVDHKSLYEIFHGRKKESNNEIIETEFLENFNLNHEDLDSVKGFRELRFEQQKLVLENMKQMTLSNVGIDAGKKFKEELKNSGWLKKVYKGILKPFQMAKLENSTLEEIKKGGISVNGDLAREMVAMVQQQNIEVEMDNGEIKINFAVPDKNADEETKQVYSDFNKTANDFSKIPYEWALPGAGKTKNKKYKSLKEEYEKQKANLFEKKSYETKNNYDTAQYINSIDAKVTMNGFLVTHPEAEKELRNIQDKNFISKAFKSFLPEKATYTTLGYIGRSVSAGFLGFSAAPIVAATMGGTMAGIRGNRNLKERDFLARYGEKDDSKEAKKYSDSERVGKKIESVIGKIKELQDSFDQQKITENDYDIKIAAYEKSLKIAIKWTEDKLQKGMINFGDNKKGVYDKYRFFALLGHGKAYSELSQLEEKWEKNFEKSITDRDAKNKKTRIKFLAKEVAKGALIAGTFAEIGATIRHFVYGDVASVQAGSGNESGVGTSENTNVPEVEKVNRSQWHVSNEEVDSADKFNIPEDGRVNKDQWGQERTARMGKTEIDTGNLNEIDPKGRDVANDARTWRDEWGKEQAAHVDIKIGGKIDTYSEAAYEAVKKASPETQEAFIRRILGNDTVIADDNERAELIKKAVRILSVSNAKFGDGDDVKNLVYEGNVVRLDADGKIDVLKGDGIREASAVSEDELSKNSLKLKEVRNEIKIETDKDFEKFKSHPDSIINLKNNYTELSLADQENLKGHIISERANREVVEATAKHEVALKQYSETQATIIETEKKIFSEKGIGIKEYESLKPEVKKSYLEFFNNHQNQANLNEVIKNMPESFKGNEDLRLDYLKIFAGNDNEQSEGIKSLFNLNYKPEEPVGFTVDKNGLLSINDINGKEGRNILIDTKNNLIGLESPDKVNAWGVKSTWFGLGPKVPSENLNLENLKKIKELISEGYKSDKDIFGIVQGVEIVDKLENNQGVDIE